MDVRLPNGMIIRGVPKGTTKDQILSKLKTKGYDIDELLKPPDLLEGYEPTKEEGVIAAAKRGAESLISSGRTALESMFGDEEEAAKRGLERGEDIAKVIVGGRAVFEGAEPAQKLQLLLAKPGDVRERLRPRQNRHLRR